jgi:hypothetical protein
VMLGGTAQYLDKPTISYTPVMGTSLQRACSGRSLLARYSSLSRPVTPLITFSR